MTCTTYETQSHYIVNPLEFYNPPRDFTRPLPIFYHRDALAQLLVFGALTERGRTLGEPLFNMPPVPDHVMRPGDWCHEGQVKLGPRNELLVLTRGPLDDQEYGEQKQVIRGYTKLEEEILEVLRIYFDHLSRSQVRLAQWVAAGLRPGFEHRRNIELYQRVGANYQSFPSAPRKERRNRGDRELTTAAFVLRKPSFNEDGATLLNVFAMDGSMALVWAYLLGRRHTDWLFEDGFRMVELSGPKLPVRASDLTFAADWSVEELLHVPA